MENAPTTPRHSPRSASVSGESGEAPRPSGSTSGGGLLSGPHKRVTEEVGYVDNYRIDAKLGQGGMAVVYRAHDTRLKRDVALKILHDHIAGREENRERFEREATAVARLQHRNIMSVYGFSSPNAPVGYIAAELIDGETLRAFVDRRGFAFPEVGAMVCVRLAQALQHAHDAGVIHRDFKPENVMIARGGVPKLMDFGLARMLDHNTMTMTGAVLGSPAHMSPEAIEGKPVDARVDIFAFGTVLYYVATGRLPFEGSNPAVILNAILVGSYADPSMVAPKVSGRLGRIIARCLETDPNDRYPDVTTLAAALIDWLADIGFKDIDAELRAFFDDPDAYEEAMAPRLVTAVERLAEAAAESGQMATALSHCDHLLALEPGNSAALRILGRVKSRRRARVLSAVLGVLLVAALTLAVALSRPPANPIEPIGAADAAVDEAALAAAAAARAESTFAAVRTARVAIDAAAGYAFGRASAEGLARERLAEAQAVARAIAVENASRIDPPIRRDRPDPSPDTGGVDVDPGLGTDGPDAEGSGEPVVAAVVRVPVDFHVLPLGARVRIDGEDAGAAGDLNQTGRMLTPGIHVIDINLPNREQRVRESFEVREGAENSFRFRVPFAPGNIIVTSERAGRVLFEGRAYPTGTPIEIPITGNNTTERTVTVQLVPPENFGPPVEVRVVVETERTTTVPAPF